jgi:hypothetical protein
MVGSATFTIETSRTEQGRIEHFGSVGGGQHDHVLGRGKAIHLGQDLVERLLALIVGAESRRGCT